MPAVTRNILVEQGATYHQVLTWSMAGPPDLEGNPTAGTPYDLSGCTARMQLRVKPGTDVLVSLDTETGGIVLGEAAGTITILMTADETDTLMVKRAVYDLEIVFDSGDVVRLVQGEVTISPNVTRTTATS